MSNERIDLPPMVLDASLVLAAGTPVGQVQVMSH